jgi:uncharacterized protein YciI
LYQLRLVDRLHDDAAWREADSAAVSRHFQYLQKLLKDGILILAGRTLNDGADRFGIAIIRAADEGEARQVMESDPAVLDGIMTARLFPYRIALMEGREE